MRPTHHNDDEIKIINATVSIEAVAESLGFVLDRNKSCRMSRKYVRGGDRIVVKDSPRGQEYYTLGKSKEEGDCGPVFNFVYHRIGERNLGKTRQILRPFIGTLDGVMPAPVPTWMIEEAVDRSSEWEALNQTPLIIKKHAVDHLEKKGITKETLRTFLGLIRADQRKNACFANVDVRNGNVIGWDIRGTQDKKFRSHYGPKGLWWGPPGKRKASLLVVAESALDALSYWEIYHDDLDVIVAATGGYYGDVTLDQIVLLAAGVREVVIATDNDVAGHNEAQLIVNRLDDAGVPSFFHRPPIINGAQPKDWNRYLLAQRGRAA